MNFFNQGIPLGRWFGISVVLHWTFLIYAAYNLFGNNTNHDPNFLKEESIFIAVLFGTVLLHEFGHALSCKAVGGQALHIVLWPLGGIAFVQPPMNPWAWLVTTACGPLVNALLWPLFWWISVHGLSMAEHQFHFSPATFDTLAYISVTIWYINKMLLLFNLIPAYPMDGGRLLQEILWLFIGYGRSMLIAGMVGVVAGGAFVALGFGLTSISIGDLKLGGEPQPTLVVIGILCMMQSFGIYRRAQEISTWRKN